jgi:hypothetical protein
MGRGEYGCGVSKKVPVPRKIQNNDVLETYIKN